MQVAWKKEVMAKQKRREEETAWDRQWVKKKPNQNEMYKQRLESLLFSTKE